MNYFLSRCPRLNPVVFTLFTFAMCVFRRWYLVQCRSLDVARGERAWVSILHAQRPLVLGGLVEEVEDLVVDLEVVEDLLVELEVVVDLEVVESFSLARFE